ncbi:hypothetical protein KHC28_11880 [Ancylobacter sonchi]|uniref:DUF6101 family protein n=1 Tax=Ancylobacter sonchi TaxID=1937790 RepID=UPI001BD2D12A|nr:DUF6101 family protein [Ancylobacter sonchi]MBS7534356.1 hypothetical protein [Ancylobacter sonchi]
MRRQSATEVQPPVSSYDYVSLVRPIGDAGWPVAFDTPDAGAEGGRRQVELHPGHVLLRRWLGGLPFRASVDYVRYRGLAIALLDPEGEDEGVAVVLVHDEVELSVTLYSAPHADDVVAEWRFWSALLGLPMLITDAAGTLSAAYPTLGRLVVGEVQLRRRRRSVLRHRRPAMFKRRAAGRPAAPLPVHRGERELIARD